MMFKAILLKLSQYLMALFKETRLLHVPIKFEIVFLKYVNK